MSTNHNTNTAAIHNASPAAPRPRFTRRTALILLDTVLVLQVATWIAAVVTAGGVTAFSEPHPGVHGALIVGGIFWLVPFALVVVVCHRRSDGHAR
jgi:hypothetical protein